MGVSRTTLSRFRSGETAPSFPQILALSQATGRPLSWFAGQEDEESSRAVVAGLAEPPPQRFGDDFVYVPRYDIEASAGPGTFADDENVVDYLAFKADFVRRTLRANPQHLALITAIGDSMEPAIRAGDLLLVDRSYDRVVDDAIYVVRLAGRLVVKRVQVFFNGAVTIKSDNPAYVEQTLSKDETEEVYVAGRVRWIGRLI